MSPTYISVRHYMQLKSQKLDKKIKSFKNARQ